MGLQRRETLTAQLTRTLQERIAAGDYPVGSKLPSEQDLIDEFGVSRTVVREAISSLRAGGVVATQQGVGAFVLNPGNTPFTIQAAELEVVYEVIAVLELRIGVETECAALAAQRRRDDHIVSLRGALDRMITAIGGGEDTVEPDLDFHRGIAEATGNRHFLNLFEYLGTLLIPRARLRAAYRPAEMDSYLNRINAQHEDIFQAIVRQDSDAARAAMRLHLTSSRERLRASIDGKHGG
ncbi:FadR family transcriptional regulator [Azospirillum sp. RWY-5-1]|uniref:FadR family transcriptional regulator n=1 Tax=Azospirillum oleiclasticum TaxID=2735135 RepID=A0ABX2T5B9_9PROT|nr:FadR/GntR family transcriptional regulator [Azospirillum oleiclasticum]NYZ12357.1 FadR family transcriptional regulator [Azospirillum oleiclasticum]NYZ19517.1 FadR family transcriptional regulator [Azospirillum oleiclasticum]